MGTNLFKSPNDLLKPKPASQIIYDQLLHSIISGEIKGGQRIVESKIAALFGVSRPPIREAIQKLEVDGLVALIPYRGVVVNEITTQEVRESLELKGMIEGFASWIGAQRFGNEIIAKLESILSETERQISDNNFESLSILELNSAFHNTIVENIHNEKLLKYYVSVTNAIRRFYAISFTETHYWEDSLLEHRQILKNIKKKDALAAERDARQHAYNSIDRILSLLKK